MDNVHQSRKAASKKAKSKNNKKPVKVVYISNPMKVKTSASEFRALVQELTGQDAASPHDHIKFTDPHDVVVGARAGVNQTVVDAANVVADDHPHAQAVEVPKSLLDSSRQQQPMISDFSFEPFDDVFMPQILDNFPGLLPSSLCCESSQVDVLRSFDTSVNFLGYFIWKRRPVMNRDDINRDEFHYSPDENREDKWQLASGSPARGHMKWM